MISAAELSGATMPVLKEKEEAKAGLQAQATQQAQAQGLGEALQGPYQTVGGSAAAPAPAPAAPAAPSTTAPTFAQLSTAGIARPPMPAPAPVATTSAAPTGAPNDLRSYIMGILQNPTTDTMEQQRVERAARGIDDEYALKDQQIREDMARRGLLDSTTYGGRLQDLNVSKRSAKEEALSKLAESSALRADDNRFKAGSLGAQLLGMDTQKDIAEKQLRAEELRSAAQMDLAKKQFELQMEVQRGNMTLAQAEFEFRKEESAWERQFQQAEADRSGSQFDTRTWLDLLGLLGVDITGYQQQEAPAATPTTSSGGYQYDGPPVLGY